MKQVALGILRSTIAVVALAGVAIALLFGFYDANDFRPALPKIEAIYSSMYPEDRKPPDNVQSFV